MLCFGFCLDHFFQFECFCSIRCCFHCLANGGVIVDRNFSGRRGGFNLAGLMFDRVLCFGQLFWVICFQFECFCCNSKLCSLSWWCNRRVLFFRSFQVCSHATMKFCKKASDTGKHRSVGLLKRNVFKSRK